MNILISPLVYLTFLISFSGALFFFFFPKSDFLKWIILWIVGVFLAFLSNNYWIFIFLFGLILIFTYVSKPSLEHIALYFALLPLFQSDLGLAIPGITSSINYFFVLNYPRFLNFVILIPILMLILKKPSFRYKRFFALKVDVFVFMYIAYLLCLEYRSDSFTHTLRSQFMILLDVVLPYYVISRCLTNINIVNKSLFAILFSGFILSFVGMFEELKSWPIYESVGRALHISSEFMSYGWQYRAGFIRVEASFQHAIPFGYFLTIVIGILIYFWGIFKKKILFRYLAFFVLLIPLLFTFARGAWISLALFFACWLLFNKKSKKIKIIAATFLTIPLIAVIFFTTPLGIKVMSTLPFVGSQEQSTVQYRKDLFNNSITVIKRKPLFGSWAYLEEEEMREMQRAGKIDIVNTYIQVALSSGLIGLVLFVLMFIAVLRNAINGMMRCPYTNNAQCFRLGLLIFSLTASTLLMIGTVSSIQHIPRYYFIIIAIGASYEGIRRNLVRSDLMTYLSKKKNNDK